MKKCKITATALAASMAVFAGGALAHDPGSSGPGTPTCIESNLMVADAQNTPFASAFGAGRVLEMNTTTGERGLTVTTPFTGAIPPVCPAHVSCPGPFKPTGILSGGEDGHAYLVSAAQHSLTEFHRNSTPIKTSPVWPTSPSQNGGNFGFVPRLLGNGFMPNGNIAQTVCDANFFNAANSDDDGSGGLEADHYFPPVNGTAARGANSRVLVVDQNSLDVVDEYSIPQKKPYKNDPRWNCPAGVLFTSEGMYVSMFHGDAIFVVDWEAGTRKGGDDYGVYNNDPLGNLGTGANAADIIRVIDVSNDGTTGTGYALNYDDSATGYDSGNRRDNLRAIRMSEDGTLFGTRRSRSAECGRDAGCNPGNFRQHIFTVSPGESHRSGSIALDPGVNIIAGVTINRMSGVACNSLNPGYTDPDLCDVETLYVGVSAGNAGCVLTGPSPANSCFEPRAAEGGGGTVYEYLIDEAHWDATDGTCTGDPSGVNTGCAVPIAQFEFTDSPGGNVEKLDPRMVMTIHEAFTQ
jgi:hypothetical protein